MGKLYITIDADADGKKLNFAFTWNGGEKEIQNMVRFIEGMADRAGVSPGALAQGVLRRLSSTGFMKDEGQRRAQMAAIVYTVLHAAAEDIDTPAPILECVATQDITAALTVREDGVGFEVKGQPITD